MNCNFLVEISIRDSSYAARFNLEEMEFTRYLKIVIKPNLMNFQIEMKYFFDMTVIKTRDIIVPIAIIIAGQARNKTKTPPTINPYSIIEPTNIKPSILAKKTALKPTLLEEVRKSLIQAVRESLIQGKSLLIL